MESIVCIFLIVANNKEDVLYFSRVPIEYRISYFITNWIIVIK